MVQTEGTDAANRSAPSSYSIEDHWITLDGARMRYLRSGSGPALLLLHGLLGYSFSWRYAIPLLAQQADVHAVDMLGMGFSDRPTGLDCCLRTSADRLLRFMDIVGIETCDLLGTSHGGAVAMMAAALAPGRIRRLILVAPVNPWSGHGKWLGPFLSFPLFAPVTLAVAPRLRFTYGLLLRRLFGDPTRIRKGTLDGYVAPFAIPGAFAHALRILSTWNADLRDLKAMLPQIADIPTLLMCGSKDHAVLPSSINRLASLLKSSRTVMLEGVGHLPYEEIPEEFNRLVAEYLSGEHLLPS
jgi:pimeloyl-ACP methyl ester carboxylesterase